jgi:hypothetical protein
LLFGISTFLARKEVVISLFCLCLLIKVEFWGCFKWLHGCQNKYWDIFIQASLGI